MNNLKIKSSTTKMIWTQEKHLIDCVVWSSGSEESWEGLLSMVVTEVCLTTCVEVIIRSQGWLPLRLSTHQSRLPTADNPFRQSHHMNIPSNSSWLRRFQCCLSLPSKALPLSFKTQNYPQGTNDGSSIDVIHCSIWRLVREGLEG